MWDNLKDWFKKRRDATLVFLIFVLIVVVESSQQFTGIDWKPFGSGDVLALITSLFVVAVFMERSIEAIITPVRNRDREKLERELAFLSKAVEQGDETKEAQRRDKENQLRMYKLDTGKYAIWFSFFFGLLISLVGLRTLQGFVEPDSFGRINGLQKSFFHSVDVILTGGVIAGGSAAIDKVGRRISSFYNLKSGADSGKTDKPDAATLGLSPEEVKTLRQSLGKIKIEESPKNGGDY